MQINNFILKILLEAEALVVCGVKYDASELCLLLSNILES